MNSSKVIRKVSEDCLSKVVWEVAKTMGKAGIAAGVLGAGAGSISLAIPILAGYIGLTARKAWKGLKSDEERSRELQKTLEAALGTERQLRDFIQEYYKDSFEEERDREQIVGRILMVQKVCASSKAALDHIIEGQGEQGVELEAIRQEVAKTKGLVDEFGVFIEDRFDKFQENIKGFISGELYEQLGEVLGRRPRLKENILEIEEGKDRLYFQYRFRWIECVGREGEFLRLESFLEGAEEKLSWWAITGKGGVGKSRMALELCIRQRAKGWYTGFLDEGQEMGEWSGWEPTRPTLMVVDYTDRRAKELGEQISSLYEGSRDWKYPVRILLLDRDEEGIWRDDFTRTDPALVEDKSRYREEGEGKSLRLGGLEDRYLGEIVEKVFEKENKPLSQEAKQGILAAIGGIDENSRPLYAMFAAEAGVRGEDVRAWNADNLHDYVIRHHKKIWLASSLNIEEVGVDERHYNLMLLATICGGIGWGEGYSAEDIVKILAEKVGDHVLPEEVDLRIEFDRGKYRVLSGSPVEDRLRPLEPDILGEYLVLKEGQKSKRRNVMGRLWETGWEIRPYGVGWFVTLLYKDFGGDIDSELIGPKRINDANALPWARTLFNIVMIYGGKGQKEQAAEYFERLEGLWGQGFAGNREMALWLAMGAFSLTAYYGKAGELTKAVEYFGRLERLWSAGFEGDREISLALARGAFSLTAYYGAAGGLSKAVEYFERLEGLWGQGFEGDREISLELAKGAFNLTAYYGAAGELSKAVEYFERLEGLWSAGFEGDREMALWLAKGAFNLANYYGKAGELAKAVGYFERLEGLWGQGFEGDREISLALARGAFNLTSYYGAAGDSAKAVEYFGRLERLWSGGFEGDREISMELAKGAFNLTAYYGKTGELAKAVEYFERLERLWSGRFEGDREIALWLAKSAVNLTSDYGKVGKLDEAAGYFERIERLWSEGFEGDREISLRLAQGAVNLTKCCGAAGELSKAAGYFERLECLRSEGFEGDREISLELANGAVILTAYYGRAGELEKAAGYFERLERLRSAGFEGDREISLALANCAFNLTKYYGEAGDLEKVVEYFERLEGLWGQGFEGDREISLRLAQGAVDLTKCCGVAGELEKAVEYFERLEGLWGQGFEGDREISLALANGVVMLTAYCGRAGELEEAAGYFERLEGLWSAGFEGDREISLTLAKGAVNLTKYYGEAGELEKAALYRGKFAVVFERYGGDEEFEALSAVLGGRWTGSPPARR